MMTELTSNDYIHSELPWTLGENGDKCAKGHAICSGVSVVAKVYGLGFPIGSGWSPRSQADADFIITAVNSFDARDAALRQAQTIIQDHVDGVERTAWLEVLTAINNALEAQ
jgi:hypothetical protein